VYRVVHRPPLKSRRPDVEHPAAVPFCRAIAARVSIARWRGCGRIERHMGDTAIRSIGLGVVVAYASLIGWLYARQPRTLAQVTGGLSAVVGVYTVDEQAFADALRFFRNDQFVEARLAFDRADPAVRDARTQFYIAYSYYRQGWGRIYHDDRLYAEGLAAIDRALALAPAGRLVVDDPALGMHTAEEVKAELEAGMRVDASDFNPARVFRTRK
jgi:hypothetical protein